MAEAEKDVPKILLVKVGHALDTKKKLSPAFLQVTEEEFREGRVPPHDLMLFSPKIEKNLFGSPGTVFRVPSPREGIDEKLGSIWWGGYRNGTWHWKLRQVRNTRGNRLFDVLRANSR